MILALRSDSQPVHVALYEQSNNEERVSKSWEAGRELSVQLLSVIEDLCVKSDIELSGISGIIDPKGNLKQATKFWTRDAVAATVYYRKGKTLYVILGDYLGKMAILITLFVLPSLWIKRKVMRV